MDTPIPGVTPQAGQPPVQPADGTPPVAPKPFDAFKQKKGIKSDDDIPKIYEDTEASLHRTTQKLQVLKQDIETQTGGQKTIDDNGKIIDNPNFQPGFQPQGTPGYGYQPQGGYQQNQPGYQQPETVFDPYTGKPIDPSLLQAANLPFGQRELFFANVALEVRENQQRQSYTAEQEILNAPEAKGFENDVRSVMNALPLHQRANKKEWQDALFRVKGMKFDEMRKSASQEGVDNFLNKQGIQGLPASPGNDGGTRLTPEQESSFQWYQANQPGMFKDRAHFQKAYSNKR